MKFDCLHRKSWSRMAKFQTGFLGSILVSKDTDRQPRYHTIKKIPLQALMPLLFAPIQFTILASQEF